jgi:hypothetical protein
LVTKKKLGNASTLCSGQYTFLCARENADPPFGPQRTRKLVLAGYRKLLGAHNDTPTNKHPSLLDSPNPFASPTAADENGEPAPAISGARAAATHAPSPPRLRPRGLPLLLPVLPARRQFLVNPYPQPPSLPHLPACCRN